MKLDEINKKAPFEVPDGYFDKLPMRIQSQLPEEVKYPWLSGVKAFLQSRQVAYALPVIIILIVASTLLLPQLNNQRTTSFTQSHELLLASVSDEDILDFLELNQLTINELVEDLNDTDIEEVVQEVNEDIFSHLEIEEADLELF